VHVGSGVAIRPIHISEKYSVEDWKALNFSTEADWQKGIDIFEDRMESRFFRHTNMIERDGYSGFVIMALDCLLIETLQQFYKGMSETPYGKSKSYFEDFLTETSFGKFFDKTLASKFYTHIRSGILHQAEVKGSSRILTQRSGPLVGLSKDGDGLIINRRLFHGQLLREYNNCIIKLRNASPDNTQRVNFRKKMDLICGTA